MAMGCGASAKGRYSAANGIFGHVYVQLDPGLGNTKSSVHGDNEPGCCSLHFDAEDDCYISFAKPGPDDEWRLDDGSAPPAKKPFLNPSFDTESRTFCGEVRWDPHWEGEASWIYEIVFSKDFRSTVGGRRLELDADGREKGKTSFLGPEDYVTQWKKAQQYYGGDVDVDGLCYRICRMCRRS